MKTTTPNLYWAVVSSKNTIGTVYGVGRSIRAAIADARHYGCVPETCSVMPISPEAFKYIEDFGGSPTSNLVVTKNRVSLASEDEAF